MEPGQVMEGDNNMGISLVGVVVGISVPLEDVTAQLLVTLLMKTGGIAGGTQAMALSEPLEVERC